jgi:integrase
MHKKTKNAHGKGGIHKIVSKSNGRVTYRAQIMLGKNQSGKPRRFTKTFLTEREAKQFLKETQLKSFSGRLADPSQMTVDEVEHCLEQKQGSRAAKTVYEYRVEAKRYISPTLGKIKLNDVTPAKLQAYYGLLNSMRKDGKPLSASVQRHIHTLLNQMFREMGKLQILNNGQNPCALVRPQPPREDHSENMEEHAFTEAQVRQFLAGNKDSRWLPLFGLAIRTGLRNGELCGLKWSDIDLDGARLKVSRTRSLQGGKVVEGPPKTSSSFRTIPLTADTVSLLLEHRKAQACEAVKRGASWVHSGYVFTSMSGQPLRLETTLQRLQVMCDRAGLPQKRVHDLRHTFATIALRGGARLEGVSRVLGHTNPAFTLSRYRSVFHDELVSAVSTLDNVLR